MTKLARKQFDREAIMADYFAGVPVKVIAAKHGCSENYPADHAKRSGMALRGRGVGGSNISKSRLLPEMPDGFDSTAFLREHFAGATPRELRTKFGLGQCQLTALYERFAVLPNKDGSRLPAATGVVSEIKRLRGKGLFTTQIAAMLRVPYRLVSEVQ